MGNHFHVVASVCKTCLYMKSLAIGVVPRPELSERKKQSHLALMFQLARSKAAGFKPN